MNSLLMIMGIIGAVVSIWQSALCCATVCCGRRVNHVPQGVTNPVMFTNNGVGQPQVMIPPVQVPTVIQQQSGTFRLFYNNLFIFAEFLII